MPQYNEAVQRSTWDKHGERVSVLDYDALVSDAATAINSAIEKAAGGRGGCSIQIPVGTYVINSPIIIDQPNIILHGEGENSILQRGKDMPQGQGMFTITASNVLLRDFLVDGMVTTPVGLNYSAFSDPMDPQLTKNTTFWVQAPSANQLTKIRFKHVTVQHTGGYSILFDARQQYLVHIRVTDCRFINNRPMLFGTNDSDLNYGSWVGGILLQGDGQANAVHDMQVSGCSFARVDGNCIWSHVYAFNRLHSNIRIEHNDFLDIGLDGILMGGINGGVVAGNTLRRVGYISRTDVDTAYPQWLQNKWAVGIDTSGVTIGVNYTGNTLTSCNGGYIDCDGFSRGVISGNRCRTPAPGDLDYGTDQIGTPAWGGRIAAGQSDWAYGINFGFTSHANVDGGAQRVCVTGNSFENMGSGAIRLYAATSNYIADNEIFTQPQPSAAPIQMGNISYPDGIVIGCDNVVINNRIRWDPTEYTPAVLEDANAGGFGAPYQSGQGNVVRANDIISGTFLVYEFEKDATSSSNTGHWYSSQYSSPSQQLLLTSAHMAQREGYAADGSAVLRWYDIDENTAELHMQLQAYYTVDASSKPVRGPLLNVSQVGKANTGSITTGNRTTTEFGDTVATGVLYGDGMYCIAANNYNDTNANSFPASVGLIRYVITGGTAPNQFQYSAAVDTNGHRIWTNFGSGSGGGGGSDKQVLYNNQGITTGDANLMWDYGAQEMTIFSKANQAGLQVRGTGAYVQSDGGFAVLTAQNYNSVQSAAGGVSALSIGAINYTHIGQMGSDPVPGTGGTMTANDSLTPGTMYWSTKVNELMVYNGTQFIPLSTGSSATPGGNNNSVQYNVGGGLFGGDNFFTWDHVNQQMVVASKAGQAAITVTTGYVQSAGGYVSTVNSWEAINSGDAGGGALTAAYGLKPYKDASNNVSGGYIDIASTGTNYPIPLAGLSAFGAADVLLWVSGVNGTVVPSPANSLGLQCSSFINAAQGFATSFPRYNCIQAPLGGVNAASLAVGVYSGAGGPYGGYIQIGHGSVAPTVVPGDTFQAGAMYWSDAAPKGPYIHNGTTWLPFGVPQGTVGTSGAAGSIQYNLNGGLAGDNNLTWYKTNQQLIVAGVAGQAAITVTTGYITSAGGLATVATVYNAIQAGSGGVNSRSLAASAYTQIGHSSGAPAVTSGDTFQQGAMYWDDGSHQPMIYNGTAWNPLVVNPISGLTQYRIPYAASSTSLVDTANLWWEPSTHSMHVSGIGIDGLGTASQVRVSSATANSGMFLTSLDAQWGNISAGSSYNGTNWIALDTTGNKASHIIGMTSGAIGFYCDINLTLSNAFTPTQRMKIDSNGNLSVNTGVFAPNHYGATFYLQYQNATYYTALTTGTDNNLYLQNQGTSCDIYIRPYTGRYVFLGSGSGEFACPNLDNKATLGTTSLRWSKVWSYALDVNGPMNVTGAVTMTGGVSGFSYLSTINAPGQGAVAGAVVLQGGSNITISQSGGTFTIAGATPANPVGSCSPTYIPYCSSAGAMSNSLAWWEPSTSSIHAPALGIDGSNNSQIRCTSSTANSGMFLTSVASHHAAMSGGLSYNNGQWIARDSNTALVQCWGSNVYFYGNGGQTVGAAITPTQNGVLDVSGNLSIRTSVQTPNFYLNANGGSVFGLNTAGNAWSQMLAIGGDNNVYLQNTFGGQDIYIRPPNGRYVFLGNGSAEYVCPNGNTSLGNGSYYWSAIYVRSAVGFNYVSTVNGMAGGINLQGGGTVSISASGGTVTITGAASTGGVTSLFASTGISLSANTGSITITNTGITSLSPGTGVNISGNQISIGQPVGTGNAVSFYSVNASTTVQGQGNPAFQNGNASFSVNSSGNVGCQTMACNTLTVNGVTCSNTGIWIGNGLQCNSVCYASEFGIYGQARGWPVGPPQGGNGGYGSFRTGDSRTVTVIGGIITNVA